MRNESAKQLQSSRKYNKISEYVAVKGNAGGADQWAIQVGNEAEKRGNGGDSRKLLNPINKQNII